MSLTRALDIAKSGLYLQEKNIGVKAGNLAAQGVDAYKAQYLVAQDLGYQDITEAGASSSASTITPVGLPMSLGVKAAGIYRNQKEGDAMETGEERDLMIKGKGYFQIQMPDGTTGYTRAGSFQMSAQGTLETIDGYPLIPAITVPTTGVESLVISQEGVVQVQVQGQAALQTIGQIQLASFSNPNGLRGMGKNAFVETEASGTATISNPALNGVGAVWQGYRESSNVNPVEEITDMIKIQHAYEHLTKVISTTDSMFDTASRMSR